MKKYPYYLGETAVENENWEEYSINVLEEIKTSTFFYYEDIYDFTGLVKDLIYYCSDDCRYGEWGEKRGWVFNSGNIEVKKTDVIRIIVDGKVVFKECSNIIPGDWIDDFLKAYDTQTAKIKEIKEKIEQANRKQFIEKYFN